MTTGKAGMKMAQRVGKGLRKGGEGDEVNLGGFWSFRAKSGKFGEMK